jgi:hypothetical protein
VRVCVFMGVCVCRSRRTCSVRVCEREIKCVCVCVCWCVGVCVCVGVLVCVGVCVLWIEVCRACASRGKFTHPTPTPGPPAARAARRHNNRHHRNNPSHHSVAAAALTLLVEAGAEVEGVEGEEPPVVERVGQQLRGRGARHGPPVAVLERHVARLRGFGGIWGRSRVLGVRGEGWLGIHEARFGAGARATEVRGRRVAASLQAVSAAAAPEDPPRHCLCGARPSLPPLHAGPLGAAPAPPRLQVLVECLHVRLEARRRDHALVGAAGGEEEGGARRPWRGACACVGRPVRGALQARSSPHCPAVSERDT